MMACGTLFTAAVASAVIVKTVPSATSRNTSLASRTPRARARTERLLSLAVVTQRLTLGSQHHLHFSGYAKIESGTP